MDCVHAKEQLERLYATHEPSLFDEPFRQHLRGCESCRALYDQRFDAASTVRESGDAILAQPELELLRESVVGAVAVSQTRMRRWHLAPLALTAAAAALLFMVRGRAPSPLAHDDELLARGRQKAVEPLGLRALCVQASDAGLAVHPLGESGKACRVRDRVGFTYRNQTDASWHLQILVRGAAGRVERAFPDASAPAEPDLAPPVSDESPVGRVLPLDPLGAGPMQIYGVFSSRALDRDRLVDAMKERDVPGALARAGGERVVVLSAPIGE